MHTYILHRPGEQLLLPLLSVHTECNANGLIYYQVVNKYKTYPTQEDQVFLDVYIIYSYYYYYYDTTNTATTSYYSVAMYYSY